VEPAAALVGDIAVPGVKGLCQRAALLAAIADGVSEIRGFGHAADTDVALDAVRELGAGVSEPSPGTIRIEGVPSTVVTPARCSDSSPVCSPVRKIASS
jgi:3-phosphoshikimate 1-carboxyvinyltransferase